MRAGFLPLRSCRERPSGRRPANKCDELPPLHVSRKLALFLPLKPAIATCRREGHTTERSFLGERNVRFAPKAECAVQKACPRTLKSGHCHAAR